MPFVRNPSFTAEVQNGVELSARERTIFLMKISLLVVLAVTVLGEKPTFLFLLGDDIGCVHKEI